jgi:carboxypeptidase Taq
MMPAGGVADRGDQVAVIDTLLHEMIVSDEMGKMLETLTPYASQLPYDSLDASLIRYMARQFARETCIPSELVSEISGHQSTSIDAWKKARASNDFKIFQPHLEKMFDLIHKKGAYLAPKGNPYDGLLEYYEPGIDSAWVGSIFGPLRPRLTELVKAITAHKDRVDGRLIRREVSAQQQLAFAAEVAESIGYDFKRGRLDTVAHPFAWGTGKGDSRITTKVVPDNPMWCIEGASHESGHAMHLQNMTDEVARTPMAYFALAGSHRGL